MNSKYLGQKFDGWKVTAAVPTVGGHTIFTLKYKKGLKIRTLTVRDNELTKMLRGKSLLNEELGKNYQLSKNIRIPQNTIKSKVSLFNLFRTI